MNENILYCFKSPKYYGLIGHYFLYDLKTNLAIHQGNKTNINIKNFILKNNYIFHGIYYYCDNCYKNVYKILKFNFYPFINCETLVKGGMSYQTCLVGFMIFSLLTSLFISKYFLILFLLFFIINYIFINTEFKVIKWKCKHLNKI